MWLDALGLLWEGHGEEVFDPDYSSHHDQDSGQVENALKENKSKLNIRNIGYAHFFLTFITIYHIRSSKPKLGVDLYSLFTDS